MRQNPRDLVHMRHVMDGPCRQQFGERHRAQRRVTAPECELLRLDGERLQRNKILCAEVGELVQELGQRFSCTVAELRCAVKLFTIARLAVL